MSMNYQDLRQLVGRFEGLVGHQVYRLRTENQVPSYHPPNCMNMTGIPEWNSNAVSTPNCQQLRGLRCMVHSLKPLLCLVVNTLQDTLISTAPPNNWHAMRHRQQTQFCMDVARRRAEEFRKQLHNFVNPTLVTSLNRRALKAAHETEKIGKLVKKLRKLSKKSDRCAQKKVSCHEMMAKLKTLLVRQKNEWQCVGRLKETMAIADEMRNIVKFITHICNLLDLSAGDCSASHRLSPDRPPSYEFTCGLADNSFQTVGSNTYSLPGYCCSPCAISSISPRHSGRSPTNCRSEMTISLSLDLDDDDDDDEYDLDCSVSSPGRSSRGRRKERRRPKSCDERKRKKSHQCRTCSKSPTRPVAITCTSGSPASGGSPRSVQCVLQSSSSKCSPKGKDKSVVYTVTSSPKKSSISTKCQTSADSNKCKSPGKRKTIITVESSGTGRPATIINGDASDTYHTASRHSDKDKGIESLSEIIEKCVSECMQRLDKSGVKCTTNCEPIKSKSACDVMKKSPCKIAFSATPTYKSPKQSERDLRRYSDRDQCRDLENNRGRKSCRKCERESVNNYSPPDLSRRASSTSHKNEYLDSPRSRSMQSIEDLKRHSTRGSSRFSAKDSHRDDCRRFGSYSPVRSNRDQSRVSVTSLSKSRDRSSLREPLKDRSRHSRFIDGYRQSSRGSRNDLRSQLSSRSSLDELRRSSCPHSRRGSHEDSYRESINGIVGKGSRISHGGLSRASGLDYHRSSHRDSYRDSRRDTIGKRSKVSDNELTKPPSRYSHRRSQEDPYRNSKHVSEKGSKVIDKDASEASYLDSRTKSLEDFQGDSANDAPEGRSGMSNRDLSKVSDLGSNMEESYETQNGAGKNDLQTDIGGESGFNDPSDDHMIMSENTEMSDSPGVSGKKSSVQSKHSQAGSQRELADDLFRKMSKESKRYSPRGSRNYIPGQSSAPAFSDRMRDICRKRDSARSSTRDILRDSQSALNRDRTSASLGNAIRKSVNSERAFPNQSCDCGTRTSSRYSPTGSRRSLDVNCPRMSYSDVENISNKRSQRHSLLGPNRGASVSFRNSLQGVGSSASHGHTPRNSSSRYLPTSSSKDNSRASGASKTGMASPATKRSSLKSNATRHSDKLSPTRVLSDIMEDRSHSMVSDNQTKDQDLSKNCEKDKAAKRHESRNSKDNHKPTEESNTSKNAEDCMVRGFRVREESPQSCSSGESRQPLLISSKEIEIDFDDNEHTVCGIKPKAKKPSKGKNNNLRYSRRRIPITFEMGSDTTRMTICLQDTTSSDEVSSSCECQPTIYEIPCAQECIPRMVCYDDRSLSDSPISSGSSSLCESRSCEDKGRTARECDDSLTSCQDDSYSPKEDTSMTSQDYCSESRQRSHSLPKCRHSFRDRKKCVKASSRDGSILSLQDDTHDVARASSCDDARADSDVTMEETAASMQGDGRKSPRKVCSTKSTVVEEEKTFPDGACLCRKRSTVEKTTSLVEKDRKSMPLEDDVMSCHSDQDDVRPSVSSRKPSVAEKPSICKKSSVVEDETIWPDGRSSKKSSRADSTRMPSVLGDEDYSSEDGKRQSTKTCSRIHSPVGSRKSSVAENDAVSKTSSVVKEETVWPDGSISKKTSRTESTRKSSLLDDDEYSYDDRFGFQLRQSARMSSPGASIKWTESVLTRYSVANDETIWPDGRSSKKSSVTESTRKSSVVNDEDYPSEEGERRSATSSIRKHSDRDTVRSSIGIKNSSVVENDAISKTSSVVEEEIVWPDGRSSKKTSRTGSTRSRKSSMGDDETSRRSSMDRESRKSSMGRDETSRKSSIDRESRKSSMGRDETSRKSSIDRESRKSSVGRDETSRKSSIDRESRKSSMGRDETSRKSSIDRESRKSSMGRDETSRKSSVPEQRRFVSVAVGRSSPLLAESRRSLDRNETPSSDDEDDFFETAAGSPKSSMTGSRRKSSSRGDRMLSYAEDQLSGTMSQDDDYAVSEEENDLWSIDSRRTSVAKESRLPSQVIGEDQRGSIKSASSKRRQSSVSERSQKSTLFDDGRKSTIIDEYNETTTFEEVNKSPSSRGGSVLSKMDESRKDSEYASRGQSQNEIRKSQESKRSSEIGSIRPSGFLVEEESSEEEDYQNAQTSASSFRGDRLSKNLLMPEDMDENTNEALLKKWWKFILFLLINLYILYILWCVVSSPGCLGCGGVLPNFLMQFITSAKRSVRLVHYSPAAV